MKMERIKLTFEREQTINVAFPFKVRDFTTEGSWPYLHIEAQPGGQYREVKVTCYKAGENVDPMYEYLGTIHADGQDRYFYADLRMMTLFGSRQ